MVNRNISIIVLNIFCNILYLRVWGIGIDIYIYYFALNSIRGSTIGCSPIVVVFGREYILPMKYDVQANTDGWVESVVNSLDYMIATNNIV